MHSVENLGEKSWKIEKVATFVWSRFFGKQKSRLIKKIGKVRLLLKNRKFSLKVVCRSKKSPRPPIRDFKREKWIFYVIWQIHLLEEEEKGLRRPPTPLEAFKQHLPSQSRIFVKQVFKIPHRYVHFIPLFFYLFHGLFESFLAYFFDYFFAYFFSIFPLIPMPKNMKNSHNVKGGFKKLEWKIAWLFF